MKATVIRVKFVGGIAKQKMWLCEGWWEYLRGLLQAIAEERRGLRSRTLALESDVIVLRSASPWSVLILWRPPQRPPPAAVEASVWP